MQNAGMDVTSWNQDSWEKYQQPQICHSDHRKCKETKESLDEGEREE